LRYLLDTNACIALINQRSSSVRIRLGRALEEGSEVFVSVVVAFELWYGVVKSACEEANAKRVKLFFAGPVQLLPFEEEDARNAGRIRALLERSGKSISAYDVMIAGQAVRHELTLVTANAREFSRVKGLAWEDWASLGN
jgi:tRNA(fMet)-specific endonuclease VapC